MRDIKFAILVAAAGAWTGDVGRLAGIGEGQDLMAVNIPVEPRCGAFSFVLSSVLPYGAELIDIGLIMEVYYISTLHSKKIITSMVKYPFLSENGMCTVSMHQMGLDWTAL